MTAIVVKLSAMQMGGISEKGRMLPVSRPVVSDNNQPSATVDAQSLPKAVLPCSWQPCGTQKSPAADCFQATLAWVAEHRKKQT
jgi:hypothetical protein